MTKTPGRIQGHIRNYAKKYPGAWKKFELFRADRGRDLPDWPDWCWCPLAAAYAIVGLQFEGGKVPIEHMTDVGNLGALAAWRMTQGIYRFDSDLFAALWSTPLNRIPVEILYRMPEWCIYIEAPPGQIMNDQVLYGWFTHLDWDVNSGRTELRFVFDLEEGLVSYMLHLSADTIDRCVAATVEEAKKQGVLHGQDELLGAIKAAEIKEKEVIAKQGTILAHFVSVVLYLCTVAADISDLRGKKKNPGNPRPTKTRKGFRTFPLDGPTTWLTGYRIGASLRLAEGGSAAGESTRETGRASPRPHIRRAHWHTYWTGPRSRPQKPVLKWLPPVPVGAGEIVPTIREVE